MKNILLLLLSVVFIASSLNGQTIQSSLVKQSDGCVNIYAKPDGNVNAIPDGMVISVRWLDQSPNTVNAVISDLLLGLENTAVDQHTDDGYTYQDFNINNDNNAPAVDWTSGSEYKIAKVCFEGDSPNLGNIQQVDAAGGSNGWVYWYIAFEGLGDLTDYSAPFYEIPGESTVNNSGAIKYAETVPLITLPRELLAFSCEAFASHSALLNWEVENFWRLSYFEIERSANGKNWEGIGQVNANSRLDVYSFIDEKVYSGLSEENYYYRLKMFDHDGNYRYSKVKSVQFRGAALVNNAMNVFPNPTKSELNLNFDKEFKDKWMTITVFDIFGKQVYSKKEFIDEIPFKLKGTNGLNLDNGIYHIWVNDNQSKVYKSKFLIQR